MKSDRGQSLILIGVGLLILAGVVLYVSLSQPRLSGSYQSESTSQVSDSAAIVNNNSSVSITAASPEESSITYPLNINTATVQELITIDGMGETRANAVIEYRQTIGSYTSVDQIKNISGFGDALYEKISPYLTV